MFEKKQKLVFAGIFFLLIVAGIIFFGIGFFYKNADIEINGKTIKVEIVSKDADLKKGLGGRKSLCADCGMLFVFPKAGRYAFWMKDMRFSLDIIWIRNEKIVHLEKNVAANFTGILSPTEEADSVLEINSGKADELGLQVGNKL